MIMFFERIKIFIRGHLSDTTSDVNMIQMALTSLIAGTTGAMISALFLFLIEIGCKIGWTYVFYGMVNSGLFHETFPVYNSIWLITLFYTIILSFLIYILPYPTGDLNDMAKNLHEHGMVPPEYVIPMFIQSMVSLTSGSGAGATGSLLIVGAGSVSWIGLKLKLPKRALRKFVLAGIAATFSGFYAAPMSGLYAMEFPHRIGMDFFEAFTTVLVTTFVSSTIFKLMYQQAYGNLFTVHTNIVYINFINFFEAVALGIYCSIVMAVFYGFMKGARKIVGRFKLNKYPYLQPFYGWAIFATFSMILPPIMFWGDPDVQNVIDRGLTPLPHYRGGNSGIVQLEEPYTLTVVVMIGFVKMFCLAWVLVNQWKGGTIFPMFFVGATFGVAAHIATDVDLALAVLCCMASVQGSVTRSPFSSAFAVQFVFKGLQAQFLITTITSSFVTYFLTYKLELFVQQTARSDINFEDEEVKRTDKKKNKKKENAIPMTGAQETSSQLPRQITSDATLPKSSTTALLSI